MYLKWVFSDSGYLFLHKQLWSSCTCIHTSCTESAFNLKTLSKSKRRYQVSKHHAVTLLKCHTCDERIYIQYWWSKWGWVYATNKRVLPTQYEYNLHELPKHQKKILLNLNLMTPSVQHGTSNRAWCPCFNNNNALLYGMAFTHSERESESERERLAEHSLLIMWDWTKRLSACEIVGAKCKI